MITVEIKNWSGLGATVMVGTDSYNVPEGTHRLMVDETVGMGGEVMVSVGMEMDMVGDMEWIQVDEMSMISKYTVAPVGESIPIDAEGFMLAGIGAGAVLAVTAMMLTIAKKVLSSKSYDV